MTLPFLTVSRAAGPVLAVCALLVGPISARAQPQADTAPAATRWDSFKHDAGGLIGNLFGGSGDRAGPTAPTNPSGPVMAQGDSADVLMRLDQMENRIRQLTGSIEQLQYRNQQLEQQVRELSGGATHGRPQSGAQPSYSAPPAPAVSAPAPGRRSDAFDPREDPNAVGAPRRLGTLEEGPGGRAAGEPLDLSTLSDRAVNDPSLAPGGANVAAIPGPSSVGPLPPPPPRNPNATGGTQLVALPPDATPRDAFAVAHSYFQHKEYALAEQSFQAFLKKYPNDRLAGDAQYWLGESLFQRQRYRDAAESFLNVSTKYEKSAKASEALLRLGQSLAALNEKTAACATLSEVLRKYPNASAGVKQGVEREQKRTKC
jgi:tol-pal system protein YbgF